MGPRAWALQYLSKIEPELKLSDVLEHAASSGWLKISDDGPRGHRGRFYPSLESSAMRYVPTPEEDEPY